MLRLQLADGVLERIRALGGHYHEQAYAFVLLALEYCQQRRGVRGHIGGEELARASRDLVLEQFGLVARTVLAQWGIESTEDIGRVVFELIGAGLLIRHPSDRIEDFDSVYDFAEAFEQEYPWMGVGRVGKSG